MNERLAAIEKVIAQGPYADTWESLANYRVPEWYRDAKFGIFIHWGVYSVPAFDNEWYPRNMYMPGSKAYEHHIATYGNHKDFGYKDFIPLFKAEKFDPQAWVGLFERAGAKYVVPVAEHHDGFQMYRSDISHFNAYEMGPHRDTLGELKAACEARGLTIGCSSHRIEHWFFMGHGRDFDSDIHEPLYKGDLYWPAMPEGNFDDLFSEPAPTDEFMEDWLERTCELIDRYRPRVLYFDWWIEHAAAKPWIRKLAAYYYNRAAEWGMEVVINYKHDAYLFGCAVPDVERGQFADVKPYFWQTDTAVALNSWCHTEGNEYREASDLVRDLVDIVSKNGCLLLNIGPRADGTIPEEDAAILEKIGGWMRHSGEAIYGARPWRKYGEGPTQIAEARFTDGIKKDFTSADIRFTTSKGAVYAIVLKASADGKYLIRSLGEQDPGKPTNFHGIVRGVTALETGAQVPFTRDGEGLRLEYRTDTDMPVAFRIDVD